MDHATGPVAARATYDPDMGDTLPLAADFPAPTREQWRSLVAAVLAKSGVEGGDPEDALTFTTYDGIEIKPLYTAEDAPALENEGLPGRPPFVRGATQQGATATGWDPTTSKRRWRARSRRRRRRSRIGCRHARRVSRCPRT